MDQTTINILLIAVGLIAVAGWLYAQSRAFDRKYGNHHHTPGE